MMSKHILITAGPTREYIDPVRYISNDSSGLMGTALVKAAIRLKARVTLIHGPIARVPPRHYTIGGQAKGVRRLSVISAREMFATVKKCYKSANIIICAAAVTDWRPARFSKRKIKKDLRLTTYNLQLTKNPDILAWLGNHKRPGQTLVGFALETEDLLKNAHQKLRKKKCDFIVANKSSTIGSDKSSILIMNRNGAVTRTKQKTKTAIARLILETIKDPT